MANYMSRAEAKKGAISFLYIYIITHAYMQSKLHIGYRSCEASRGSKKEQNITRPRD